MGDAIIRSGDFLKVTIAPPVLVPVLQAPVALLGSGTSVLAGDVPVCLLGDELPAELTGPLAYTAPPFTIPGAGTLTVTLPPANMTAQTMCGKPLLIKGAAFPVCFTVETPATQPAPAGPVPDPAGVKPGTAVFLTTNATVTAS